MNVIIGEHIYTTDYYQVSAFNANDQIVSIYYYAHANNDISSLQTKTKPFDFLPEQVVDKNAQSEVLRWIAWDELTADSVDLPIDKIVVNMIKAERK